MNTYTVRYERDERGWWLAEVVSVPGCHTQGRSIVQARERIREALGLFVDNADKAKLIDDIQLPEGLHHVVALFIEEKAKAAAQQAALQAAGREMVVMLGSKAKLSMRDVGELVGLSHQRIQQLVKKANDERGGRARRRRPERVAAG